MGKTPAAYPKRYVKLVAYRDTDPDHYMILNGRALPRKINGIWTLRDEAGVEFETQYPCQSGNTPNSLYSKYREWRKSLPEKPKKNNEYWGSWYTFLIQTEVKFKFYQRKQNGARWHYRHMGQ